MSIEQFDTLIRSFLNFKQYMDAPVAKGFTSNACSTLRKLLKLRLNDKIMLNVLIQTH